MTAVLAAAARAVAYAVLGAALVLASVTAMLWPAYGPQGPWTVACGVAWEWLGKRRRGGA